MSKSAPKYVLWTDHRAGHNNEDQKIALAATDLLGAMGEATQLTLHDDNLYCVCIFERIPKMKNKYQQILRSDNGYSFHVEGTTGIIERHTCKDTEWFEFRF